MDTTSTNYTGSTNCQVSGGWAWMIDLVLVISYSQWWVDYLALSFFSLINFVHPLDPRPMLNNNPQVDSTVKHSGKFHCVKRPRSPSPTPANQSKRGRQEEVRGGTVQWPFWIVFFFFLFFFISLPALFFCIHSTMPKLLFKNIA